MGGFDKSISWRLFTRETLSSPCASCSVLAQTRGCSVESYQLLRNIGRGQYPILEYRPEFKSRSAVMHVISLKLVRRSQTLGAFRVICLLGTVS